MCLWHNTIQQHASLLFQERLDQIHVVTHSLIWKLPWVWSATAEQKYFTSLPTQIHPTGPQILSSTTTLICVVLIQAKDRGQTDSGGKEVRTCPKSVWNKSLESCAHTWPNSIQTAASYTHTGLEDLWISRIVSCNWLHAHLCLHQMNIFCFKNTNTVDPLSVSLLSSNFTIIIYYYLLLLPRQYVHVKCCHCCHSYSLIAFIINRVKYPFLWPRHHNFGRSRTCWYFCFVVSWWSLSGSVCYSIYFYFSHISLQ